MDGNAVKKFFRDRDPDKLVMLYEHFRSSFTGDGYNVVSPANFRDLHQSHVVARLKPGVSALPAIRASRIEPMQALRME
jgi:hypothetical protein